MAFRDGDLPLPWHDPDTPADRHHCELHHHEQSLIEAVASYAREGLAAGDAVVIITPPPRQHGIARQLALHDVDAEAESRAGNLRFSDPAAFRDTLFVDGLPDRARYRAAMDQMLDETRRAGARDVRVYADLVDALWRAGNRAAVVRMEELSQEYCIEHRLRAFCGYVLDGFEYASYHPELEAVCRRHCAVRPTIDDERLRAAVDAASLDVLGIPLSVSLSQSSQRNAAWWQKLPLARRTLLWLRTHVPSAMTRVLERARTHY